MSAIWLILVITASQITVQAQDYLSSVNIRAKSYVLLSNSSFTYGCFSYSFSADSVINFGIQPANQMANLDSFGTSNTYWTTIQQSYSYNPNQYCITDKTTPFYFVFYNPNMSNATVFYASFAVTYRSSEAGTNRATLIPYHQSDLIICVSNAKVTFTSMQSTAMSFLITYHSQDSTTENDYSVSKYVQGFESTTLSLNGGGSTYVYMNTTCLTSVGCSMNIAIAKTAVVSPTTPFDSNNLILLVLIFPGVACIGICLCVTWCVYASMKRKSLRTPIAISHVASAPPSYPSQPTPNYLPLPSSSNDGVHTPNTPYQPPKDPFLQPPPASNATGYKPPSIPYRPPDDL